MDFAIALLVWLVLALIASPLALYVDRRFFGNKLF